MCFPDKQRPEVRPRTWSEGLDHDAAVEASGSVGLAAVCTRFWNETGLKCPVMQARRNEEDRCRDPAHVSAAVASGRLNGQFDGCENCINGSARMRPIMRRHPFSNHILWSAVEYRWATYRQRPPGRQRVMPK